VTSWSPTGADFYDLVGDDQRSRIMRFKRLEDRKLLLASQLMQRAACAGFTGLPSVDIRIERTKGGKPFLSNRPILGTSADTSNWNYNVSHEGRYVVMVAEPILLCGVDVAAPLHLRRRFTPSYLNLMQDSFTKLELQYIQEAGAEGFQKLWSLKEAFVKARGDGLAFEFCRCEFVFEETHDDVQKATVSVDGVVLPLWHFSVQLLPGGYYVSVARGPPDAAIDANGAFSATFRSVKLTDDEIMAEHAKRLCRKFVPVSVSDLVGEHFTNRCSDTLAIPTPTRRNLDRWQSM